MPLLSKNSLPGVIRFNNTHREAQAVFGKSRAVLTYSSTQMSYRYKFQSGLKCLTALEYSPSPAGSHKALINGAWECLRLPLLATQPERPNTVYLRCRSVLKNTAIAYHLPNLALLREFGWYAIAVFFKKRFDIASTSERPRI